MSTLPLSELWDQADRDRLNATVWANHAMAELAKAKAAGDAVATDLWRGALQAHRRRALRYADMQRLIGAAETSEAIRRELARMEQAEKAAAANQETQNDE